jgi:chromosome segregation protein
MSEETFIARISELEEELAEKDHEIIDYLYKLEQFEAKVTELQVLIPEEYGKRKKKKQQAANSKIALKLEEKDKEIRDLMDRLGFLRKDKIKLQQEFEKFKKKHEVSSVIRVEDLRKPLPLNALVKDLQDKVNKQKSEINQLRDQVKEAARFDERLNEKENLIETYKSEINELNQKMKELSSPSDSESGDSVAKILIEDLQKQLNKSKREIIELKQKLSKKTRKSEKKSDILKINKLEDQIKELNELIETKNADIENLKNGNISKGKISGRSDQTDVASSEMIKTLKEDLQNQLNKSKLQVKSLQEQIRKYKSGEISGTGETHKEMEGKLKMQREMAMFLEKQLKTKEGEIETIKNEAVQIKKRYRQLENHLKLRDQKLNEMQKQIDSQIIRTPSRPQEDPHLSLRLRELKGMVQDLEKKNVEQRSEIAQLRKK